MPNTNFDFNQLPHRRDTGSIKWDRYPNDIPYWVADMDFASPECVVNAIHHRVDHGVFGYAQPHSGLVESVLDYLERTHDVNVTADDLIHLPGMVPAISLACRAVCRPGDQVLICSPVYYPFFKVAADAGAELVDVPHIRDDITWRFDWVALEQAVTPRTKIMVLCNPQNPLGRAFTEEEIIRLAEFCDRHELLLVSDEIHCDLILDPEQHHFCALRLPEELRKRLITLMAPSKTYNIAGLGYSFAVIENEKLRQQFNTARGCTLPEINLLAMIAAEAAYRDGEPWRCDLVDYLRGNRDTLAKFIHDEMPDLKIHEHAATYLYWIDCSALNVANPCKFFSEEAGVFLTDGGPFGSRKHVRFNFGCPRAHMLEGLEKMKDAIDRKHSASSS